MPSTSQPTLFPSPAPDDARAASYAAWRREQRDELLAGPYGADARALRAFLRRLAPNAPEPAGPRDLVAFVEASRLREADEDTRRAAFRMVSAAVVWARGLRGLPLWSDPLWGEPESAWQACRRVLGIR